MYMSNNDQLQVEGVLSKGFGLSPKLVMKDKRLTIEAKAIYAYIASYAGQGDTAFPSVSLILKDLKISKERFLKHRKLLEGCGYISVERLQGERGRFGSNIYTLKQIVHTEQPCTQNTTVVKSDDGKHRGGDLPTWQNLATNNNNSFNNNNITNKNINNNVVSDESDLLENDMHKKIIDYLNEKANKRFNHKAKGNQKFINGRIAEGYTFEDFKKVIDTKCSDWIGTKWEQYLRPQTLFNSEKFESYLNQKPFKKKHQTSQQGEDGELRTYGSIPHQEMTPEEKAYWEKEDQKLKASMPDWMI